MTLSRAIPVAILAILLVGCTASSPSASPTGSPPPAGGASPAGSPSPAASPSPAPSTGSATLLLKVTSEGGFINPAANLAALPRSRSTPMDGSSRPGRSPRSTRVRSCRRSPFGMSVRRARRRSWPRSARPDWTSRLRARRGSRAIRARTSSRSSSTARRRRRVSRAGSRVNLAARPRRPVTSAPPRWHCSTACSTRRKRGVATAAQETAYLPTGYLVFVAPGGPASDPAGEPVARGLAARDAARDLRGAGGGRSRDRRSATGDRSRRRCGRRRADPPARHGADGVHFGWVGIHAVGPAAVAGRDWRLTGEADG